MGEVSNISWTDATWNPWIGCVKVSPACTHCYAERDWDNRRHVAKWGSSGTRVVTSDSNWAKPKAWNRKAEASGIRQRVFCSSLADIFEDWQGVMHDHKGGTVDASMSFIREQVFWLIDETPYLDWMLLTKRPENIQMFWPDNRMRHNVWLGTSVENQEYADKRIPELLNCRHLSPVLFLSCEPLLGPVDLMEIEETTEAGKRWFSAIGTGNPDGAKVDWIISGGESGPSARPSNADWFRSLRDQCAAANVPYHFKQWGEYDQYGMRVGKVAAGNMLDGRHHLEFPEGVGN